MTGQRRPRFSVLGSFRVDRDGVEVGQGPRLQRTLLAILVVDARRVVPVDRLIDLLWREVPPAAALASLQAYISLLRRIRACSGGGRAGGDGEGAAAAGTPLGAADGRRVPLWPASRRAARLPAVPRRAGRRARPGARRRSAPVGSRRTGPGPGARLAPGRRGSTCSGHITQAGYTGRGYISRTRVGPHQDVTFRPAEFPEIRTAPEITPAAPGSPQTTGGRTGLPTPGRSATSPTSNGRR
jgi:hypothetical protein